MLAVSKHETSSQAKLKEKNVNLCAQLSKAQKQSCKRLLATSQPWMVSKLFLPLQLLPFNSQGVNPLGSAGLLPAMVVTIQERVALIRDGYQAQTLPANLLVTTDSGKKFVKILPSSGTIVRLCCCHSEDLLEKYTKCKNPSLSSSEKLKGLKELLEKEVTKQLEELKSKDEDSAEKMWGEKKGASSSKMAKPRPKLLPESVETLDISLNDTTITCLYPSSWKSTELCVLLNGDMLEAVFQHLSEDCEDALTSVTKRTYKRKKTAPE